MRLPTMRPRPRTTNGNRPDGAPAGATRRSNPSCRESLRKFHDEQCLHDADWCGLALLPTYTFPLNSSGVTIVARQANTLIPEFLNTLAILQYTVTAPPIIEKPVVSKAFSDVQPIWLYDEIDLIEPGVFSHSILVSNGLVVTIQFREFRYHIAPLLDAARNGSVEQEKSGNAPFDRPQLERFSRERSLHRIPLPDGRGSDNQCSARRTLQPERGGHGRVRHLALMDVDALPQSRVLRDGLVETLARPVATHTAASRWSGRRCWCGRRRRACS